MYVSIDNMDSLQITPNEQSKFTPTKRLNKRQKDFIINWVDASSETFGNAYQSAIKAGFSPVTARRITANAKNLEWVKEAKDYMDNYSPLHIISGFQHIAKNGKADRDRIQALDRLAKIKGMYIERSQSEVNVTFTNSVPRPTLDLTPEDSAH